MIEPEITQFHGNRYVGGDGTVTSLADHSFTKKQWSRRKSSPPYSLPPRAPFVIIPQVLRNPDPNFVRTAQGSSFDPFRVCYNTAKIPGGKIAAKYRYSAIMRMAAYKHNAMYTPAQTAKMLDIAPSTLRRYVKVYGDYLSETARKQSKARRYNDADIVTLKKIKTLSHSRRPQTEIEINLQIVEPEPIENTLALLPEVNEAIVFLRAKLDSQDQEIAELKARIEQLETPWYQRIFRRE